MGGCDPDGSRWDGFEFICPTHGVVCLDDPFRPENDAEPISISPRADGWVTCPSCGVRFTIHSEASYFLGRHRKCGQKLKLQKAEQVRPANPATRDG